MGRGPRKVAIKVGAPTLTRYGGVSRWHRFLSRSDGKDLGARQLHVPQRNNRYTVGQPLLALVDPRGLGLERLATTSWLKPHGVFQCLTGLPSYPDATALRRFLLRLAPTVLPKVRALHDRFLSRMTVRPRPPSRLICDVDSTVLVVYGKQEQAKSGYTPIKRGHPSSHPLLCFEGQSQAFWPGELRPSDAHTARGARDLLPACFAKRPPGGRLTMVRADKGGFDHTLIDRLEAHRTRFVMVARLTASIKRQLAHLRYGSPSRGIEVAALRYQPPRWPRPSRFVVIRRPQPEELTAQWTLFKLGQSHDQVLVTNLPLRPLNLWRFYNDRAGGHCSSNSSRGMTPLAGSPRVTCLPTRPTSTSSCGPPISSTGSSGCAYLQNIRTPPSRHCATRSYFCQPSCATRATGPA